MSESTGSAYGGASRFTLTGVLYVYNVETSISWILEKSLHRTLLPN